MSAVDGRARRVSAWLNARQTRTVNLLLVAGIMAFVWSLDTHGTYAGSGDEPHYGMIAHSIVFDRDLDVANDYADPTNLVGGGTLQHEAHAVPGKDGRLRPVHDIGLPVLFAAPFAVAYAIADHSPQWISPRLMARARLTPALVFRHLLSLTMMAVAGFIGLVLFHLFRPWVITAAPAFWWAILFVLSPPLLSHAYLFFTEIPTAAIVIGVYAALTAPALSARRTLVVGTAVGFLLLLHIRNTALMLALAVWFLWQVRARTDRLRLTAAFGVPVAALIAARTAINIHFWGSLVTSPHVHPGSSPSVGATLAEIGVRCLGLLLDQEHGLLLYAPVYLVALPGLIAMWTADRRTFLTVAFLVTAYCVPIVLPMINYAGWAGGWSPAARFLVPITPLLALLAFRYRASVERVPATVRVIILVQWLLNLIFWSKPKLLWNEGTGQSALARLLSRGAFDLTGLLPTWHRPSTYTVVVSVLCVFAWIAWSIRAARLVHANDRA